MSETTETSEQETKQDSNQKKRIRHRKKLLYENIRKQIEFYFSDANLSKDRFLGELIKADPLVPVDMFLKFNKVRTMTNDIVEITKALKNSTALELSEDKSKVQRKTPFLPYDADTRTVYVESIPYTGSLEWLQGVFSDYGKVAYISLPKFKQTNKIKGYAFIEYEKPEEAQKCISAFTKMGCKLPTTMHPEDLSTIKLFSVQDPPEVNVSNKKIDKEENYEPPKKKSRKAKDRKKSLELKLEAGQESDVEKKVTTPVEDGKTTDAESKDESTSQDELSKTDKEKKKKKKIRKRSRTERGKSCKVLGMNDVPKDGILSLQILSKNEWKALRNKYLNLQRKHMKELKRSIRGNGHPFSTMPAPSVIEPGRNSKEAKPLEKIKGVFVKSRLPEPCTDIRATKRQIRSNIHVQHVDVKEGQVDVLIRFDSSDAASQYCSITDTKATVLSGAEEEKQWSRATAAVIGRRPRGQSRLMLHLDTDSAVTANAPASPQPTATHIRFDE